MVHTYSSILNKAPISMHIFVTTSLTGSCVCATGVEKPAAGDGVPYNKGSDSKNV